MTEPYYQDDFATIYHGDCREVLAELTFDVVATDPPYGTGYYETDVTVMDAAFLCSLDRGNFRAAIFGYPEKLAKLCVESGYIPTEWVTWWPTNAGIKSPPNKTGLTRESEHIAVFGDTSGFAALKVARTRPLNDWKGPNQRGTSNGDPLSKFAGDVWTHKAPGIGSGGAHLRRHPNEKPQPVMNMLITGLAGSSPVTVLDPFMGSGTTLVAAKWLGHKSIGVEIDERHCEMAVKRLAQEVLDLGGAA